MDFRSSLNASVVIYLFRVMSPGVISLVGIGTDLGIFASILSASTIEVSVKIWQS